MKLTQHELILSYIEEFGEFKPARMCGFVYKGQMFGSECGRRCRELREAGKVLSEPDGKFERYYIIHKPKIEWVYGEDGVARMVEIESDRCHKYVEVRNLPQTPDPVEEPKQMGMF